MKNILNTRKNEIVNNIGGEEVLKKLQKVKLLKLMELEIQQLLEYWSLSQTLEIINSELGFKISKTLFYDFYAKNLKKNETSKSIKRENQKQIEVDKDTKKEIATLDEDELSAVAMFQLKQGFRNEKYNNN